MKRRYGVVQKVDTPELVDNLVKYYSIPVQTESKQYFAQ